MHPGVHLIGALAFLHVFTVPAGATPYAYVANLGSNEVSVIDTETNAIVATIPAGDDPDGAAVTPDGTRVYITNFASDDVSVIDATTNTLAATVPVGAGPVGAAATNDGRFLYVTDRESASVSVVNTESNTVVATIDVDRGPDSIAITPDGAAYVTNSFTRNPGLVSTIDTDTNRVVGTVRVNRAPNRVTVTPDGATAYVTNFRSWNTTVVDAATNTVRTTVRVRGRPSGIAVNPNGAYVYLVTLAGVVHVIDTSADRVVNIFDVANQPYGIGISRNGALGYVANFRSNTVSVLDLVKEIVVASVSVGEHPFALAVNCQASGCTDPPFTPAPRPTPTATPSATKTQTPTLTRTRTRTPTAFGTRTSPRTPTNTPSRKPTNTAVPGTPAAIEVGTASGSAGNRVTVSVTLETAAREIAGTENEIHFRPQAPIVACERNAAIGREATNFAFSPRPCDPGVDCAQVKALVLSFANLSPIPYGRVLYRRDVQIAADAPPGTYPLEVRQARASDSTGVAVTMIGLCLQRKSIDPL